MSWLDASLNELLKMSAESLHLCHAPSNHFKARVVSCLHKGSIFKSQRLCRGHKIHEDYDDNTTTLLKQWKVWKASWKRPELIVLLMSKKTLMLYLLIPTSPFICTFQSSATQVQSFIIYLFGMLCVTVTHWETGICNFHMSEWL